MARDVLGNPLVGGGGSEGRPQWATGVNGLVAKAFLSLSPVFSQV